MKNDHIIHFIDTKRNLVNEISKELMSRTIYQKSENFKGTIGYVLITKKSNKKIFGIIIKKKIRDEIQEKDIMEGFQELKNEMIQLNFSQASISQSKSNLKIPWDRIRDIIRLAFLNTFKLPYVKARCASQSSRIDYASYANAIHPVSEDTRELQKQWREYDINIFGRI